MLGYLQVQAKEAVAHLQLSSSNYEFALLILEDCFADSHQDASEYLDVIFDVKRMNDKSASDIAAVYNILRNGLD